MIWVAGLLVLKSLLRISRPKSIKPADGPICGMWVSGVRGGLGILQANQASGESEVESGGRRDSSSARGIDGKDGSGEGHDVKHWT
jgi:hypothetical protein